ncbi:response regulator [Dankookia sp. P2]|uniref:response regulator n=1 Tax=Dankookia sp. P2 TaxID=3423955 RepID=UPI003D678095
MATRRPARRRGRHRPGTSIAGDLSPLLFSNPLRLALGFALATAFAWLFLSLWRRDRAQPALGLWGAAHAVWAAAALLFAAEALLPPPLGITLGNLAVALGYGLVWAGARRFAGRPARPVAVAAGLLAWTLLTLIPGFAAQLPTRVLAISIIVVAYDCATALVFRRGMRQQRLASHFTVIFLLLAHGLTFALRGALVLPALLPQAGLPLVQAPATVAILHILSLAFTAALTVALVALSQEQAALTAHAVLAAARDAAAAASAGKSRFLARMSHELRTPLNGVLGIAEALARDPGLGPRQREQAATLERAGRHLLAIVNDALDLARVEAGRLALAPAPVRLRRLLEEALELIQPAAAAKRIRLRLDLDPGLPEGVLADSLRLRQVLLNLLGNAVESTPEHGRVLLCAAPAGPGLLRLAVEDSGPGIPEALRPRLFDEFAQGPQSEVGAGLGLAISAALARAMGGSLDHAPGPGGQGSRFALTVPLAEAAPPPAPPAAPAPELPRPLRLLVVDDARVNREVVRALLRPEGHLVEEAASGGDAIAALRRGPLPDLVLMDLNMPGMDGLEATAAIRALDGPARRVPIIALTGDAMPEAVAAGRAAGMDGHLTKPLQRALLLAELARLAPSA